MANKYSFFFHLARPSVCQSTTRQYSILSKRSKLKLQNFTVNSVNNSALMICKGASERNGIIDGDFQPYYTVSQQKAQPRLRKQGASFVVSFRHNPALKEFGFLGFSYTLGHSGLEGNAFVSHLERNLIIFRSKTILHFWQNYMTHDTRT